MRLEVRMHYPSPPIIHHDDHCLLRAYCLCCAAIQKHTAVLSEEMLNEREIARNGTSRHASKGAGKSASGKGAFGIEAARESTYNLGVAAGLISQTHVRNKARSAHSAAAPRLRDGSWNDMASRGRCVMSPSYQGCCPAEHAGCDAAKKVSILRIAPLAAQPFERFRDPSLVSNG